MVVGGYYMPFAAHYAFSAHDLQLHPKVPHPWALDTYSTVLLLVITIPATLKVKRPRVTPKFLGD